MKAALLPLVLILVALRVTGGVELCRHASGEVHSFAGENCEGRHADEHGELRLVAQSDHSHHHDDGSPNDEDAEGHHEPCSHDRLEGAEDWGFAAGHLNLANPIASGLVAIVSEAWMWPQTGDDSSSLERSPRAPPGTEFACAHFAATVRLIV